MLFPRSRSLSSMVTNSYHSSHDEVNLERQNKPLSMITIFVCDSGIVLTLNNTVLFGSLDQ